MSKLILHEVGMRDGLQMEKTVVPTDIKLKWIDKLIESNVDIIQVGSFVHKEKMPQMADTDELFILLNEKYKSKKVVFSGLVLNERGLERAMKVDVDMICMGVSASNSHSQKNTGMTTEDAIERIIKMAKQAIDSGKNVQVSVQSAFGCGFEGDIPSDKVLAIIDKYMENGLSKISLADTAGLAYPQQVDYLFGEIARKYPNAEMTCHFHNTYGLAMANVYAAMNNGVGIYESAFGGLGGCPFTKTAAGNVATEDIIHYFHRLSKRNDIDIIPLLKLTDDVREYLGKDLQGYIQRLNLHK